MKPTMRVLSSASALAVCLASLATAGPANADNPLPTPGECYRLSNAQAAGTPWPSVTPVSCHRDHTMEVYKIVSVPIDQQGTVAEAARAVSVACSWRTALEYAGVSVPKTPGKVINNPVRVTSWTFLTGPTGRETGVCAAGPYTYKKSTSRVVSASTTVKQLVAKDRATLRICVTTRPPYPTEGNWNSVECGKQGSWTVTRWVTIGNSNTSPYPGTAKVRAWVAQGCRNADYYSYPTRANWETTGGDWFGWCYSKK